MEFETSCKEISFEELPSEIAERLTEVNSTYGGEILPMYVRKHTYPGDDVAYEIAEVGDDSIIRYFYIDRLDSDSDWRFQKSYHGVFMLHMDLAQAEYMLKTAFNHGKIA